MRLGRIRRCSAWPKARCRRTRIAACPRCAATATTGNKSSTACAASTSAGATLDWAKVDGPYRSRTVVLPTYPFQRKRFWIATRQQAPSAHTAQSTRLDEHPLLGHRLPSPLAQVQFEGVIGTESISYLNDHRVFGAAILPATGFIELALAAGLATLNTDQLSLDDMLIQSPLIASDDESGGQPRTVQTILTPSYDGFEVQVFSQAHGEANWSLHATGNVSARSANIMPAKSQDLADVRSRFTEMMSADAHYDTLRERGLDFGPSLRGLRAIWRRDGEAFGEIRLPDIELSEAKRYTVHPALLDACLQLLAVAIGSGDVTYLPIGIEHLRLFGRPGVCKSMHISACETKPPATQPRPARAISPCSMRPANTPDRTDGSAVKARDGRPAGPHSHRCVGWMLYEIAWQPAPIAHNRR